MKQFTILFLLIFYSFDIFAQTSNYVEMNNCKKEKFSWIGFEYHPMRTILDSSQMLSNYQISILAIQQRIKERQENLFGDELEKEKLRILLNSKVFAKYKLAANKSTDEFSKKKVEKELIHEYNSSINSLRNELTKSRYYAVCYDTNLGEYSFDAKGFRYSLKPTEYFDSYQYKVSDSSSWLSLDEYIHINELDAERIIRDNPSRKITMVVMLRDNFDMNDDYKKKIIFCAVLWNDVDGSKRVINIYPNREIVSGKIINLCNNALDYNLEYDFIQNENLPSIYENSSESESFYNILIDGNSKSAQQLESTISNCREIKHGNLMDAPAEGRLKEFEDKKRKRVSFLKQSFKIGNVIEGFQLLPGGGKRNFTIKVTKNRDGYISGLCNLEKGKRWVVSLAVDDDGKGARVGFYYADDYEIGAADNQFLLSKEGCLFGYTFFCRTSQMVKTVLKLK